MESTWHRVSTTLLDAQSREGTVSAFFDYNLGNWCFGLRFGHDPNWYDISFELGPLCLCITYWRFYPDPPHDGEASGFSDHRSDSAA